jgi:type IV pilus assembly protein PilM
LKALRCVPSDEPNKIVADAFDFIEYPKILSQPEADPVELVNDAIKQFLSRNKVSEDHVAISVPGQSGLARFIKLPPVESKKIPDIVRYEARQQIPFALEDVVWDYQQMAGGSEEDGFALETEVGLFAMKREQVFRALRPFTDAGIEVDLIQLTPLALYNFVVFDQMQDLPSVDSFDPKDPPPSTIVVSLGTDTTDLVVTNGYRVWQRNIPLGGNHFTKALTKELKLTFAKAEHLKRNALKAEDPKAVFLAMRPVFNDLVTEVQRSISFFQSVDRTAKIGRVIPLGNAMKLRGLQKYLGQSLGYEVVELKEYHGLSGAGVVGTPAFKDNLLSFGVCYGLALQGLKQASLRTNLIPPEIIKDRLWRAKKPWAVATVAAILLGCAAGFFGSWRAFASAQKDQEMNQVLSDAKSVVEKASSFKSEHEKAKTDFNSVRDVADRLSNVDDRRMLWPELLAAISQCVPQDKKGFKLVAENPKGLKDADFQKQLADDVAKSERIYIDSFDCEFMPKVEDWFTDVRSYWGDSAAAETASAAPTAAPAAAAAPAPADAAAQTGTAQTGTAPTGTSQTGTGQTPAPPATGAQPADGATAAPAAAGSEGATTPGPSGEGWIIQITGHHFHNQSRPIGDEYVKETLLMKLLNMDDPKKGTLISLPISVPGPDGKKTEIKMTQVSIKDLGISYPVLMNYGQYKKPYSVDVPLPGWNPTNGGMDAPTVKVDRYDFVIQFCWKETPLSKRIEQKTKQAAPEKSPALAAGPDNATAPKPN